MSLIEDTRQALDRNTAAIANAPCGQGLQEEDSDDAPIKRKRPPGPKPQV